MPDTFQAVGVLLVALLPGALYIWGFEREAGRWGISAADRVLRFVGASAALHAAALPLTWNLWRSQLRSGRLAAGSSNLWLLWLVAIGYVLLPVSLGSVIGASSRRSARWVRFIAGRHPAPRAWDHLFAGERPGWLRLRLRSGAWIGGLYANAGPVGSYAAGYPDPQDLYLAMLADLDPVTGAFVLIDGHPQTRGSGLLVRWDEVEYLEFTPAHPDDATEAA